MSSKRMPTLGEALSIVVVSALVSGFALWLAELIRQATVLP